MALLPTTCDFSRPRSPLHGNPELWKLETHLAVDDHEDFCWPCLILTMWGPPLWCECWFINPMKTIVASTINHSEIGVMFTNLAIVWGPHIAERIPFRVWLPKMDFWSRRKPRPWDQQISFQKSLTHSGGASCWSIRNHPQCHQYSIYLNIINLHFLSIKQTSCWFQSFQSFQSPETHSINHWHISYFLDHPRMPTIKHPADPILKASKSAGRFWPVLSFIRWQVD